MSFPTGRAVQPPWANSPLFGAFIYRPETDEIVTRDGRRFARPENILPEALAFASYDGPLPPFEYFGTPPEGAASYVLANGRTQTIAQPASQSGYLPLGIVQHDHSLTYNIAPLVAQSVESSIGEASRSPTRISGRTGPTRRILPQSDTNVVFTTPTADQRERDEPSSPPPLPRRGTQGMPINNAELVTTLFPGYGPRRPNFFTVGRVFMILCSEPADGASVVTSWAPGIVMSRMGNRVFTPMRRFVVIDSGPPGAKFSWALPINTYAGQGVARPGVIRSHHCIIHSSDIAPQPTHDELPRVGEDGMRPVPIRVILNNATSLADRLDPMSRVHLAGPVRINHGNRTRDFGVVSEQSEHDLRRQFWNVWGDRPLPLPPIPPRRRRLQARPHRRNGEESSEDVDGET